MTVKQGGSSRQGWLQGLSENHLEWWASSGATWSESQYYKHVRCLELQKDGLEMPLAAESRRGVEENWVLTLILCNEHFGADAQGQENWLIIIRKLSSDWYGALDMCYLRNILPFTFNSPPTLKSCKQSTYTSVLQWAQDLFSQILFFWYSPTAFALTVIYHFTCSLEQRIIRHHPFTYSPQYLSSH